MALVSIPIENAVCVRRPRGSRVKFINQSGIDVYFMMLNPGLLNSWIAVTGSPIFGTKLAANGGEFQIDFYPCDGLWFRAFAAATTIEVQ